MKFLKIKINGYKWEGKGLGVHSTKKLNDRTRSYTGKHRKVVFRILIFKSRRRWIFFMNLSAWLQGQESSEDPRGIQARQQLRGSSESPRQRNGVCSFLLQLADAANHTPLPTSPPTPQACPGR